LSQWVVGSRNVELHKLVAEGCGRTPAGALSPNIGGRQKSSSEATLWQGIGEKQMIGRESLHYAFILLEPLSKLTLGCDVTSIRVVLLLRRGVTAVRMRTVDGRATGPRFERGSSSLHADKILASEHRPLSRFDIHIGVNVQTF
jgi:hypothetical protein